VKNHKMKVLIDDRITTFVQALPVYWIWFYWICPTAWTLYGLITSQLGQVTSDVNISDSEIPVREYLRQHFGYHYGFLPYVAIWHVGLVILFGVIFATAIRSFNFQRR
jgi:hypothetical protein